MPKKYHCPVGNEDMTEAVRGACHARAETYTIIRERLDSVDEADRAQPAAELMRDLADELTARSVSLPCPNGHWAEYPCDPAK